MSMKTKSFLECRSNGMLMTSYCISVVEVERDLSAVFVFMCLMMKYGKLMHI